MPAAIIMFNLTWFASSSPYTLLRGMKGGLSGGWETQAERDENQEDPGGLQSGGGAALNPRIPPSPQHHTWGVKNQGQEASSLRGVACPLPTHCLEVPKGPFCLVCATKDEGKALDQNH